MNHFSYQNINIQYELFYYFVGVTATLSIQQFMMMNSTLKVIPYKLIMRVDDNDFLFGNMFIIFNLIVLYRSSFSLYLLFH